MRRGWRRVNNVLAGACVGSAVVNAVAGEYAVAALEAVLAIWILLANRLGARLDEARADRQLVIDAWTAYAASGMNALERARRIREYHQKQRLVTEVHAVDYPCGTRGLTDPDTEDVSRITCPICVALTQPEIEVQS